MKQILEFFKQYLYQYPSNKEFSKYIHDNIMLLCSPGVEIINTDKNDVIGRCHNYAFQRIFSGKEFEKTFCSGISFDTANQIRDILFEKTHNPKNDDLVIYTDENGDDTHYGLYKSFTPNNSFKIESKWGSYIYILLHDPDKVPTHYGNNISFYTLKNPITNFEKLRSINNNIKQHNFLLFVSQYIAAAWVGLFLGSVLNGYMKVVQ